MTAPVCTDCGRPVGGMPNNCEAASAVLASWRLPAARLDCLRAQLATARTALATERAAREAAEADAERLKRASVMLRGCIAEWLLHTSLCSACRAERTGMMQVKFMPCPAGAPILTAYAAARDGIIEALAAHAARRA